MRPGATLRKRMMPMAIMTYTRQYMSDVALTSMTKAVLMAGMSRYTPENSEMTTAWTMSTVLASPYLFVFQKRHFGG